MPRRLQHLVPFEEAKRHLPHHVLLFIPFEVHSLPPLLALPRFVILAAVMSICRPGASDHAECGMFLLGCGRTTLHRKDRR
jgi:hypothetical protein